MRTPILAGIFSLLAVVVTFLYVGYSLCKQYSITGNVAILASRLEQLNKQFQFGQKLRESDLRITL